MSELLSLVANVGFPIAVAAWLLTRIESRLEDLTVAVYEVREALISSINDNSIHHRSNQAI